jgi:hypothetical protein
MTRPSRILLKVLYWLAVVAVSVGILIGLILFLESRDNSQVGHGARVAGVPQAPFGPMSHLPQAAARL